MQRKKSRKRDLRPTRGRVSGAHPDERDPQLLDTTVGRLVDDHGWASTCACTASSAGGPSWSAPRWPSTARPESFAEGKLVVRTDSTAWATQLRLLAPTVVRRLNEELGHGTVTLIEVAGPAPADLEEGPAVGPRRPRAARHLRLIAGSRT